MEVNEGVKTFLESIQPKPIDYGTNYDADDGNIFSDSVTVGTMFRYDNIWFSVMIQKVPRQEDIVDYLNGVVYDASFGVSLSYQDSLYKFTDERIASSRKIFSVFSYIVYVLDVLVSRQQDSEYVVFDGRDAARMRVYNVIVNNKPLRSTIENTLGFSYKGFHLDHFIFKKV